MLIATGLALTLIMLAWWLNSLRKRTPLPSLSLASNCLLTKYPLLFVPGPKSLFYFHKYWNWVPDLLKSYGYEVLELSLDWQPGFQRKTQWQEFLTVARKQRLRVHAVGDPTSTEEFEWLSTLDPEREIFATLNILSRPNTQRVRIEDLKPPSKAIRHVHLKNSTPLPVMWSMYSRLHRLSTNEKRFDPYVVGLLSQEQFHKDWPQYLHFAISLAENEHQ